MLKYAIAALYNAMKIRLFSLLALVSLACIACQSSQSTTKTDSQPAAQQIVTNSLPPTQSYELQVNTTTGVVMRLTQIAYSDDSMIASLAITNGSNQVIQLNAQEDMFLYDDLKKDYNQSYGNTYRLSVPPNNPKVEVQPGTTIKGQFVFIGRLAPQAKFLGLVTNDKNPSYGPSNKPNMKLKDIIIKR